MMACMRATGATASRSCSLFASFDFHRLLPLFVVCLGLASGRTFAQTGGPPLPATAASTTAPAEGQLEEVTVTARFRAEKLQETPLAITAVSGDTLAARGETDVTNLAAFVPNAVINPLGAGWGATIAASIRGVGLSDNSLSFEPGVPIYVDGVYLGRPQGAILDLLDLDRVEVLRGPQGTLFGKNAIGGTVSLISKAPTGDGHGYVDVGLGDFNRRDFRGAYDISVVPDKLFARVSFSSKRHDGYVDVLDYECIHGPGSLGNGGPGLPGQPPIKLGSQTTPTDSRGCVIDHQGNENVQSARVSLRYIATDTLEANLTGDYTTQNQEGPPDQYDLINGQTGIAGGWNAAVGVPVFGIPWDQRFLPSRNYTNYDGYSDPLTGHVFPNVNDMTEWGISNVDNWSLAPAANLKAVTAYRKFSNSFGRNSSGSPLPINYTWDTSDHEQFSEEITLSGNALQRLDWTLGGFYYHARDSNQGFSSLFPLLAGFEPSSFNDYDNQTTQDYAAFLHGVYHFTDKASLEVGTRYTTDEKHAVIFRQEFAGPITIPHTAVPVFAVRISPKIGFTYQFQPDIMGYIQFSSGFRGGGFGPRPSDAFQVRAFKPEDLKTTELGIKSEWFDHRLRWNSALFYSRYTNLQEGFNTVDPTGNPWFSTVNVGASRIYGFEAELLAEPVTGLQLQGSFGYLNYRVTDAGGPIVPGQGQSSFGICITHSDGSPCVPPRTPKYTAGLSAQYTANITSSGSTLTTRVDSTYQSAVYFTDLTYTAVPGQQGYALVNGRLTWDSPNKEWSVSAWGTNLTNKFYYQGKLSLQVLGFEEGNPGAPRMWGINLRRAF
jgi:iron complex outermembrane recepter protein